MVQYDQFIEKCQSTNEINTINDNELKEMVNSLEIDKKISQSLMVDLIHSLSFFLLGEDIHKAQLAQHSIDIVIKLVNDKETMVNELIRRLKPHLLRTNNSNNKLQKKMYAGLNPKIGLSFKEDEQVSRWKADGGIKYMGLFSLILQILPQDQVSVNLWWIIAGILNLLDDTSDLKRVKLTGVKLLDIFIRHGFQDANRLSFKATGLFKLCEPILSNMCYYGPPSFDDNTSLQVWSIVFPLMQLLYKTEYKDNDRLYHRMITKLASDVILRNMIPRLGLKHEELLLFQLDSLLELLQQLKGYMVTRLQRIVYTLGECIIKDPYFTLFDRTMLKTIQVITKCVEVMPLERTQAHKYNYWGLALLIARKCQQEGKLEVVLEPIQRLTATLSQNGSGLNEEDREKLEPKLKDIDIIFT